MNLRTAILLLFLLPAIGCSAAKGPDFPKGQDQLVLSVPTTQEGIPRVFATYELSPGDLLDVLFQIQSWNSNDFTLSADDLVTVKFVHAPELNEIQQIRPDGRLSLPYVGEVMASGLTLGELTQQLKQEYSTILNDPDLYIVVADFRNRINELKKDLHTASRGLSRLVTVRPDGYVTFPMVGDVFVAGRTIPEVKKELDVKYDQYLAGLHVDLFLEKQAASVIYVLGEVKVPGGYPIHRPSTVLEAITLAGSYTSSAKLENVMVIRAEGRKVTATRVDLLDLTKLKSNLFLLRPNDIILVPRTRISEVAELMRQLGDIVFFRGWSIGTSWAISDRPMIDHQLQK
ncbi:MAG: polysaccharide biosynthesis/export family protein [Magnetococcales bacterium]|nr:polysaccharide biosynthesis/export family protein [Magnetococcales bacterium]